MQDRQMFMFSVAFIVWSVCAILIPYLRRKHDLVSARSFFLLGGMLYVGFSGINATRFQHFFDYSSSVYLVYYFYIVVFFAVFTLAFKKIDAPRRWAEKQFQKWPPMEGMGLWIPFGVAMVIIAGQVVLVQIPGLDKLFVRAGITAPVFALTFALTIWRKSKLNPMSIALVAIAFFCGAYLAFRTGAGRRPLYSLAVTIPICLYWWHFRYRKPMFVLGLLLIAAICTPVADSAFRAVRWKGHFGSARQRESVTASTRWQIFKESLFSKNETMGEATLQIGHNSAEIMLMTTYIYTDAKGMFPKLTVKPLHSLYVIATLPFPRSIWEEKPRPIGLTLPFDSGVLGKNVVTNWGPGIVSHAHHDGGFLVLILYAIMSAMTIRYLDELFIRHPDNPYVLAFMSSASVQIVGFIRGDIATMVPLALMSFLVMLALLYVTRMMLGSRQPATNAGYESLPHAAPA